MRSILTKYDKGVSMVTSEQVAEYLKSVPPLPKTLKEILDALKDGDLSKAARVAEQDPAIVHYLKQVVNSAAYGFRQELKAPPQIFSALGVQRAKQLLYAYMIETMAPKRWRYFDLQTDDFRTFQIELMRQWERLVQMVGASDRYFVAAAVISAGLVVADAIFGDYREDVILLQEHGEIDLDTLLQKVAGYRFRALVTQIAKKWEVDEEVMRLVELAFGEEACDGNQTICRLAKLLHLLLFYALSRPKMMQAGCNAFITFNPDFVEDVMDDFQKAVPLS